jgi:NTP pyrophosphatase (non-canonical NTP hydrolase)
MSDTLTKILYNHQDYMKTKIMEECGEVISEICHESVGRKGSKELMHSEMGDLLFRIGLYVIVNDLEEEMKDHINKKTEDLLQRIQSGNWGDHKKDKS